MVARIISIQIGGAPIYYTLKEAFSNYKTNIEFPLTPKINFTIQLEDGTIKSITFRQEGEEMVAYGNFEGLKNFLEFAQELNNELVD